MRQIDWYQPFARRVRGSCFFFLLSSPSMASSIIYPSRFLRGFVNFDIFITAVENDKTTEIRFSRIKEPRSCERGGSAEAGAGEFVAASSFNNYNYKITSGPCADPLVSCSAAGALVRQPCGHRHYFHLSSIQSNSRHQIHLPLPRPTPI